MSDQRELTSADVKKVIDSAVGECWPIILKAMKLEGVDEKSRWLIGGRIVNMLWVQFYRPTFAEAISSVTEEIKR